MIQQVNETAFARLSKRGACVVKFGAEWCGPCRAIEPRLAALSGKLPSVTFLGVDVDQCRNVTKAFGLRKVPTVVLLKDGVEMARREGVASESDYLSMIQDHV